MTIILAALDGLHRAVFASDSGISESDSKQIIHGFRKIREIPVRISIPIISDGKFSRYANPLLLTTCAIAYAGSTLAAMHAINKIEDCLGCLLLGIDSDGQIELQGPSHKNHILGSLKKWPQAAARIQNINAADFVSADALMEILGDRLCRTLEAMRVHQLDATTYDKMNFELALAINCLQSDTVRLAYVKLSSQQDDVGKVQRRPELFWVDTEGFILLGLSNELATVAEAALSQAVADRTRIDKAIFEFVVDSVRSRRQSGFKDTDFPVSLAAFTRDGLQLPSLANQSR